MTSHSNCWAPYQAHGYRAGPSGRWEINYQPQSQAALNSTRHCSDTGNFVHTGHVAQWNVKNILNKSKSIIHKKHCSVGTERRRCVCTCRHLGTAHGRSVFNWNCIMLKHSSDLPVTRWFTALLLRWSFIFIWCRWNCLEKTKTKDWVNKIRELVNLLC